MADTTSTTTVTIPYPATTYTVARRISPHACLSATACLPPFPPQAPRCLTRARLHAPLEQWLTLQAALAAKQVTPIAVPIATVPVYYSTPVYYYDTSVSICALCGCLQTLPAFSVPLLRLVSRWAQPRKRCMGWSQACQPRWSACVCTQSASAHPLVCAKRREVSCGDVDSARQRALACQSSMMLMGSGMCLPSISSLCLFLSL